MRIEPLCATYDREASARPEKGKIAWIAARSGWQRVLHTLIVQSVGIQRVLYGVRFEGRRRGRAYAGGS